MAGFQDLTGQRFGNLIVLERGPSEMQGSGDVKSTWICKCDCGNTEKILARYLKRKHRTKCTACTIAAKDKK